MLKSDLRPPYDGPNSNPVLHGVAAVLAELFPPVTAHTDSPMRCESQGDGDGDGEQPDHDRA